MLLNLKLRTRQALSSWKQEPAFVERGSEIETAETALLICDMWDAHWCRSAEQRCGVLAGRMNPVLVAARARGIRIIHAPSDCMAFYQDTPQRQCMLGMDLLDPPPGRQIEEPPLPIDDSDGGCPDVPPCTPYLAWSRQHPTLEVAEPDFISDEGAQIYSLLRREGIGTLLIMGVHTNFCVLKRSFGIRQMTRWGVSCVLVRDLTDALYNPTLHPQVSHEEATALVIRHIERFWCPSINSSDLLR